MDHLTEKLIMRREERGMFRVNEEWPDQIQVSLQLLASADHDFLKVETDRLVFNLSNGRASYRISHWDETDYCLFCVLIVDSVEGEK